MNPEIKAKWVEAGANDLGVTFAEIADTIGEEL